MAINSLFLWGLTFANFAKGKGQPEPVSAMPFSARYWKLWRDSDLWWLLRDLLYNIIFKYGITNGSSRKILDVFFKID